MEDNIDSVKKMESALSRFHNALLNEVNPLNEEALFQLWDTIKKLTLPEEGHRVFIQILLNLIINDPKSISKSMFKAIRIWRKSYKQGFDETLVEELVKMLESLQDVTHVRATVCRTLLEQFEVDLSPNALITIIKNLRIWFKNFDASSSDHSRSESLKEFLKLYVIILQRSKNLFCDSINNQSDDLEIIQEDLKYCFVFFINCLAGVDGKCGLLSLVLTNCIGFSFCIFSNKDGKYSQLLLKLLIFAQTGIPFDNLPILSGITVSSEEVESLRNKPSTAMQILRGVFSCCKHDPHFNAERMDATMKVSFNILRDSCYTEDASQRNAFKSMEMWWNDCLQLSKIHKIDIFAQFNGMVDDTMKLIYQYWDNHQANQSVNKILELMLQIDVMQNKDIREGFTWKTTARLLSEPIYERGKYRLLSVLIKKLGAELFLSMKRDFLLTLVPCLENNNLAPAASRCFIEVTKSVYTSHKTKEAFFWQQHIWPALDAAITHSNEVISHDVFRHWIQPVIQYCSHRLKDAMLLNTSYSQGLRIRAMTHLPASGYQAEYSTLYRELVLTSLTSLNDVARVDAWSIICRGRAQDVPLSVEDVRIIKEHLPLDFNSDNPAFRQSLVQCLRELVERVRRFVSNSMKSKDQISLMKKMEMNLEFVVWLKQTCLKYLVPAASFQRKVTALSILKLILNSFPCKKLSNPSIEHRHNDEFHLKDGQLIAKYDGELQVDRHLASQMLQAMEDEVPEIRQMAAEIILEKVVKKEREFCLKSMQSQSELLIGSVKQQRAELGALFAKCLFHIHYAGKQDEQLIHLVRCYCREIEDSIQGLQENMLTTARSNSPFGRMYALSLMISTVRKHNKYLLDNVHFTDTIARASKAASQCITFFLKTVFSCQRTSGDYVGSADFEEISSRIQSMIIADDNGKQDGGTMLSDDYAVVLACAWQSLRYGAALISEAESLLLEVPHRSDDDAVVERNCRTFYSILSYCRHSGAIESAYESFVAYLCSLGATATTRPLQILDAAISTLESTGDVTEAVTGATITRRSAGNPLLVKAVLTAMVRTRHAIDELYSCVTRLRTVADSGRNLAAASDKVDLPAVDAMYGLKSLLDDSYLGPKLNNATVLVPALETALRCIAANVWVVCNAATHLLGAVAARMLGQKHIEDCSSGSSLTAGEFFGRFPGVLTLAREILSQEDSDPRVFPLLSILSRLRCGGKIFTAVEESEDFVVVRKRFFHLIGNKSHSIRTMSARCCLSFYSVNECLVKSLRCLIALKLRSCNDGDLLPSQNSLHGWLNFISNLMQSLTCDEDENTKFLLSEVMDKLLFCTWIADLSINTCPFTASIYINMTRNWAKDERVYWLRAAIESSLDQIQGLHSVGASSYIKAGVQRLMEMNVDIKVMKFGVWESCFHEAQLDYMIESLTNDKSPGPNCRIQAAIKLLNRSDPAAYKSKHFHIVQSKYTELIVTLFKCAPFHSICEILEKEDALKLIAHVTEMSGDCEKYLNWRCHQINALSTLLSGEFWRRYSGEYPERNRVIEHWVELAISNPTFDGVAECLRLSAAKSLTTVGEWFATDRDKSNLPLPLAENYRIIVACISLLHDENLDIRHAACKMIYSFTHGKTDAKTSMAENDHIPHPKYALSMFLDFIEKSNFIRCSTTIRLLIEKFFILPHPQTSTRLFEKQSFNAYIENWSITEQLTPILKNAIKTVEISDLQLCEWLKVAVEKMTILVELLDYRNTCCKENKVNTQNNARVSEFSRCTLLFVELIMSFYQLSPATSPDPNLHHQLVQLLDKLSQNVDFWDASTFSRTIIQNLNK